MKRGGKVNDEDDRVVFFFKQKTAYEIKECDWSSDVCSSDLDVQVRKGLLEIAPFATSVNNGKLNFAASINLKEKPMVLRTTTALQIMDKININDQVSRALLVYLNPIFKDQANVTGIASFHAEKLAIPLSSVADVQPEIVGTIGIEDMKMETLGLLGNILSRARTGRYIRAALLPTKFVLQIGRASCRARV